MTLWLAARLVSTGRHGSDVRVISSLVLLKLQVGRLGETCDPAGADGLLRSSSLLRLDCLFGLSRAASLSSSCLRSIRSFKSRKRLAMTTEKVVRGRRKSFALAHRVSETRCERDPRQGQVGASDRTISCTDERGLTGPHTAASGPKLAQGLGSPSRPCQVSTGSRTRRSCRRIGARSAHHSLGRRIVRASPRTGRARQTRTARLSSAEPWFRCRVAANCGFSLSSDRPKARTEVVGIVE